MRQQIYGYIVDDIIEKIKDGTYPPGEKLPTEKQFCEIYDAGQTTIKKALKELINTGYVKSVERVGNYVQEAKSNEFAFNFDMYGINGKHKITEHIYEPAVKVTVSIPEFNNGKETPAILLRELFYSSKTLICERKLFVLFRRGVLSNTSPNGEEEIKKFVKGLGNFRRGSRIIASLIDVDSEAKEVFGENYAEKVWKIKRWDLDTYGNMWCYSIRYIKADSFTIESET